MALDTLFKSVTRRREGSAVPRILWKNLNGDTSEAFSSRVAQGVSSQIEVISTSDAESMWNILASIIKDAVKDSLGVAIGTSKTHTARRESWWLCEDVQSKVAVKVVDPSMLPQFDCYYSGISQSEVKTALQKMGRNKVAEPDQIPIEARRSLWDEGIFWLTSLFNKIFTSVKMPKKWRLGEVIHIFKNKGDVQGSAIRPYLFALILDELSRGIQEDIPWCLIFADDIVLVLESVEGLNNKLENWREALEDNDLKLKGKFYRVTIRPYMLHRKSVRGAVIRKALANRLEVAELRMLRWTYGKIMLDMITNRVYRAELEVYTIINKMREGRLRRGRPKLMWEDRVKHDIKKLLLSEDMTSYRNEWRARIRLEGYVVLFYLSLPCFCLPALPEVYPQAVSLLVGFPKGRGMICIHFTSPYPAQAGLGIVVVVIKRVELSLGFNLSASRCFFDHR
ncbi:retrovirus-related pol polyprotein LINE-1 [Tanacetum coccineum]